MDKKEILKRWKENHPVEHRADYLLQSYNQADRNKGRGKGDLTRKWIIDNIFTKPCVHCGKEGWDVIGCNRLDNDKPHTMDNVEPCCDECNYRLRGKDTAKAVDQIDKITGEVVHSWKSTTEASQHGYNSGGISLCCNGKLKTHKGYIWKYVSN